MQVDQREPPTSHSDRLVLRSDRLGCGDKFDGGDRSGCGDRSGSGRPVRAAPADRLGRVTGWHAATGSVRVNRPGFAHRLGPRWPARLRHRLACGNRLGPREPAGLRALTRPALAGSAASPAGKLADLLRHWLAR
ncbi:hypothetical protein GCM10010399_68330 [Dactylosporangium fulvum]